VPGNALWPVPVQVPGPPIWVAGNSQAALDRAARIGDGWILTPNQAGTHTARMSGLADLERSIVWLRERARELGRLRPIDMQIQLFSQVGAPDVRRPSNALLDEIETLAGIGVTAVTVETRGGDRRAVLSDLEWYGSQVIPRLPSVLDLDSPHVSK
jgi:alkanesulfonate monooxygenase SsuD/methylene tetrahydromethanopterin reductase-like flavin-dependent oxidoreductase (luciferase family)